MTNGIWPNDGSHKYREELDDLRSSVRRLVGEWREKQQRESDTFKACADELSALIDGKDGER